jgi:uncharacterized protein YkwD
MNCQNLRAQPFYTTVPDTTTNFADRALAKHNAYRQLHQDTGPLTWDSRLAQDAQSWANRCVWGHSTNDLGENLAKGTTDIDTAVSLWYNEINSYDYNNPGFALNTGHFTQVVWKGTKSVGCAVQHCPNLENLPIIVCNYSPAGTWRNSFRAHVTQLK